MLTLQDIQSLMSKLEDWSLEGSAISKVFMFKDFKEALEFVNKVGEIAEKMEHHPDFIISGASVKLTLSTHSEGGLTRKDFEVAEEIGKLQ